MFHQDEKIQEILSWFYFESRQDQNKKLEIDFKTRNCYQDHDFLTINQEISWNFLKIP